MQTMARPHNFSPGPAALPEEVLRQAQAELLDYRGGGLSVLEMSHRSPEFMEIAAASEADLRSLLQVPDGYRLFFLHGGATLQFAAVPLNLLRGGKDADYVETGAWSAKAIWEARKYCEVNLRPVPRTAATTAFRRSIPGGWANGPPICICAPTKPSAACSSTSFPICKFLWWRTCRRTCFPGPSIYPASP